VTCIVGVARDGDVVIGGDRAAVSGWEVTRCGDPKVFRVGAAVAGGTTSFRMLDILQYDGSLRLPTDHDCGTAREYLVSEWVPRVRAAFKEGGFLKVENNREEGGGFLLGWQGRLFKVASELQVIEAEEYDAVGAGEAAALGALYALSALRLSGGSLEQEVALALEAAAAHNIGVRPPFDLLRLSEEA
jgi:ATP-dependent protease HslVU (ClpYQ) peptidase subunit